MSRGRPLGEINGSWPNRLRELRLRFGLSQPDVGAALGVSYIHVGRLERGQSKLTDGHIAKLLELMPVEPWEFRLESPDTRTQRLLKVFRQMTALDQDRTVRMLEEMAKPAGALADEAVPFVPERRSRKRQR